MPLSNSSNLLIDEYLNSTYKNYVFYKYIPFIKYANSEQLIRFRKMFASLRNKTSVFKFNKGYEQLDGFSNRKLEKIPSNFSGKNKYFNEINNFAKNENLNIVYFSAPVSLKTENSEHFNKLKISIPQLHDFHNVISDEKYFYDNLHVNHVGATAFTNILIENLKL